jgi:hypothetical protein
MLERSCDRNKNNLQNLRFTCNESDLKEINDVGQEKTVML